MTIRPNAGIQDLDELTITIVVDNATDTLSSIPPGVPQLPEMAYLLGRIPPTGEHDGHDCVVTFDHLCVACHGFSALGQRRTTRDRPRHYRCPLPLALALGPLRRHPRSHRRDRRRTRSDRTPTDHRRCPPGPTRPARHPHTVQRLSTSCGYSVPFLDFKEERPTLTQWASRKSAEELDAYRAEKNATSIDGLPIFQTFGE